MVACLQDKVQVKDAATRYAQVIQAWPCLQIRSGEHGTIQIPPFRLPYFLEAMGLRSLSHQPHASQGITDHHKTAFMASQGSMQSTPDDPEFAAIPSALGAAGRGTEDTLDTAFGCFLSGAVKGVTWPRSHE